MSKNPKISVVMSVYNGEKYLREAMESILNQTFTDFEFIIVNDGSTDNSLKIIKSYNDERIRIINNEKNIGLTQSLNKALKQAKGEYIARQDADDISLPNRFEEQIKYFEKYPEVALVGTSAYIIDEDRKLLWKKITLPNPNKGLFADNQFIHGSVMFRKVVIEEVGAYNELLKYSQDYELWLRIARDYRVRNLTDVLYMLRYHKESIRAIEVEKGMLYHFFSQKLAMNKCSKKMIEEIKNKSIFELYSYLDAKEKALFHRGLGHKYVKSGNLRSARGEYKKAFSSNPFDIRNSLHVLLSFFGRDVIERMHEIYEKIIFRY